ARRHEMKFLRRRNRGFCMAIAMLLLCGLTAFAQAPAAAPQATPAAQAAPAPAPAAPPAPATPAPAAAVAAPAMDAPLDIKAAAPPSTDELAKGDPSGTKTGTVSDVIASDTKKGLTLADTLNQVGQNRIAINFVWTLITGFLVMFMQAGFAVVETGLTRAKNANHTMMMNFMVYGVGMLAYWLIGFAIQMGGVAPVSNLGGLAPLNHEAVVHLFGKDL